MENERFTLSREFYELDEELTKNEFRNSEIEKRKKAISGRLVEIMTEESISSFRDPEIEKTFSIDDVFNATVRDEDAFFNWLEQTGQDGAIKRTIHASTRKSIVKEFVEKTGQEVPGVETSVYTRVKMLSSKNKKGEVNV